MARVDIDSELLIELTSDIVTAHVSNNSVAVADVAALVRDVHGALAGLTESSAPGEELKPAVPVRASIKPDHIVCLEDGRKFKTLKRHLMSDHGLTPEEYRARWGLPADYSMVARDYAEKRRMIAKKSGLGRDPGQKRGRKPRART